MSHLPVYTSNWPNLYLFLLSINILTETWAKADRKAFKIFLLILLQTDYY